MPKEAGVEYNTLAIGQVEKIAVHGLRDSSVSILLVSEPESIQNSCAIAFGSKANEQVASTHHYIIPELKKSFRDTIINPPPAERKRQPFEKKLLLTLGTAAIAGFFVELDEMIFRFAITYASTLYQSPFLIPIFFGCAFFILLIWIFRGNPFDKKITKITATVLLSLIYLSLMELALFSADYLYLRLLLSGAAWAGDFLVSLLWLAGFIGIGILLGVGLVFLLKHIWVVPGTDPPGWRFAGFKTILTILSAVLLIVLLMHIAAIAFIFTAYSPLLGFITIPGTIAVAVFVVFFFINLMGYVWSKVEDPLLRDKLERSLRLTLLLIAAFLLFWVIIAIVPFNIIFILGILALISALTLSIYRSLLDHIWLVERKRRKAKADRMPAIP